MKEYIAKAQALVEALPYIKKFRGKEILIKYGGAALTYQEVRDMVLQEAVHSMRIEGVECAPQRVKQHPC